LRRIDNSNLATIMYVHSLLVFPTQLHVLSFVWSAHRTLKMAVFSEVMHGNSNPWCYASLPHVVSAPLYSSLHVHTPHSLYVKDPLFVVVRGRRETLRADGVRASW
jgi:hypothetical protein